MIELREVSHEYRPFLRSRVTALSGVSLAIPSGEVLGIAGPNGAGKSTLISILLGYLRPTRGEARIGGMPARTYIEAHGVGYVPESVAFDDECTARDTLCRLSDFENRDSGTSRSMVADALSALGLDEYASKQVKTLSKGTVQRLALAQTLLSHHPVLILDEPTNGLDPQWAQWFRTMMRFRHGDQRTTLIASHDLNQLERLCDRVAIVSAGAIQKVVDTRLAAPAATSDFLITIRCSSDAIATAYPGALRVGEGKYRISGVSLEQLNAGIARLLSEGAVLEDLRRAESALERHFMEAVQR